jgi:hypothetical protein
MHLALKARAGVLSAASRRHTVQTTDPKKPAIEQRWPDDDHDDAQQNAAEQGLVKPQRESESSTAGGRTQRRLPSPTA